MTEWTLTRVSEMADIVSGGTPKTEIPEYWNGDISWLSVKDFAGDTKHVYSSEKTITELGLNNSATQLLFPGDVIISARGTVGEIAQIGKTMAFNQSCYGLRAKEGYSSDYLYYVLKYQIKYLKKVANGAVFDTIILKTFDKMKLYVPDLATQKKIADILSAYDDLIENNLARISLLEKMASELYKEWFVRFRFPGHEAAKFVDGVPEGWTYGVLSDIMIVGAGKTRPESGNRYPVYGGNGILDYADDYNDENSIIIGRVGAYCGSVYYEPSKCWVSDNALYAKSKFNSPLYTYYLLRSLNLNSRHSGTGQPLITQGLLNKLKTIIAPISLMKEYDNIVSKLFLQQENLQRQNHNLTKQRDLLLPRLMSGKLSVEPLLADTA